MLETQLNTRSCLSKLAHGQRAKATRKLLRQTLFSFENKTNNEYNNGILAYLFYIKVNNMLWFHLAQVALLCIPLLLRICYKVIST